MDMIACAKSVVRATVKVAHEADVPLAVISGVTVVLEDHGQDFLEFDIRDGRIVETRPFQGDIWNGSRVLNRTLATGGTLILQDDDETCVWSLRHPVAAIRPLDRVRIGAIDV